MNEYEAHEDLDEDEGDYLEQQGQADAERRARNLDGYNEYF